jgi:predicted secreted Zn-dependent protease
MPRRRERPSRRAQPCPPTQGVTGLRVWVARPLSSPCNMPRALTAQAAEEAERWAKLLQDVEAAKDDRSAVALLAAFVDHAEQRLRTLTPDTDSETLAQHMQEALAQISTKHEGAFARARQSEDVPFVPVEEELCVHQQ